MVHHNINEFKIKNKNGISEIIILQSKETFSKILSVKIISLDCNKIITPIKILGDIFYFILNGKGSLTVEQLKGNWTWPLNSESAVWIPPMSNFTIKNVGDMPLRIMEFCSKYHENKDSYDMKSQLIVNVVNRLQRPIEFFNNWYMHNLFSSRPEAKKIYFSSYDIIYPKGYLSRHVPNLDCEEVQYVVSGNGKMSVGDVTYDVKPGSLVYAPPNTFHDIKNTSEDELMELVIYEAHS
jgi:mannose-6-phosphate isomerase-like protein (cupin superfamily)